MSKAQMKLFILCTIVLQITNFCGDCMANRSTHANLMFGTFICEDCAHFYQQIDQNSVLIKTLDEIFSSDEVSQIKGNHEINAFYEKNIPDNFIRPNPSNNAEMSDFVFKKYIIKC